MSADNRRGSILAADFGSVYTRVVLIDPVDGVYRLIARGQSRTTDSFPANDVSVGFDRALQELSDATGRQFISEIGQVITPERQDGSGVDLFALTASLGRPLRIVVVGLVPDMSIASALRAASGTYIDVAAVVSLDDGRDEEGRLNAVLLSYPDVVFIAGGTELGAEDAVMRMAKVVRMAVAVLDESRRPTVIYSGNSELVAPISELFEGVATLLVAQNVRPSLEEERLESARLQLGKSFDHYKESRSESFAMIGAMSQTGILPTAQSYGLVAEYLGKVRDGGIAFVDVGSAASTLAVSLNGDVTTSIRTDVGVGHSAPAILEAAGVDAVRRWLPFNITDNELRNYALNKSLYPPTIPMTMRDLHIEHALLKAGVRAMLAAANPSWQGQPLSLEMAVGAGSALTGTGHPGYDALLLLDTLQPSGVTVLQTDPYALVPAMGAVAIHAPDAVVQLLDDDNLSVLGTCFNASGSPRLDKPAMRVEIKLADGRVEKHTVLGGHLWVYPLPIGHTAEVKVRCRSGASVNGKRSVKLTVTGGRAGVIFDARGRPLPLAMNVTDRAAQIPLWIHEMTGDPPPEIPPEWLEAVRVEQPSAERGPRPERRRRGEGRPAAEEELAARLPGDDDEIEDIDELRDVLS